MLNSHNVIRPDKPHQSLSLVTAPCQVPQPSGWFGTLKRSATWWETERLPSSVLEQAERGSWVPYRVDIDGRLVQLLVGLHPKNSLHELLLGLVEVRRRHEDGSAWKIKVPSDEEDLVVPHPSRWPTFFTHADVQQPRTRAVSQRHAEAGVGCGVGEHLAGRTEAVGGDPLHRHILLVDGVQRP